MSVSEKTVTLILDAASHVLAMRGEAGSMAEVACAAGVGRSTLYRHFPTREALLEELARVALAEAGDRYIVLLEAQVPIDPAATERAVVAPIRRVLERGQADGVIRADIDAMALLELLGGLIVVSIRLAAERQTGIEETAATIQRVFVEGVGTR
jgi:AcrR family transcriptional regulator